MSELDEISQLLARIEEGPAGELSVLLAELPAKLAHILRLCAIPHSFDARLLSVLDPNTDAAAAAEWMDELANLSVIGQVNDELYVHDRARSALFAQWLQNESGEFAEVSQRLRAFFDDQMRDRTESEAEGVQRRALFHQIGADQAAGFDRLRGLVRTRYNNFRYSDCQALLVLAREYGAVLTRENGLTLLLYEGLVAEGMRDLDGARERLERVANEATGLVQIEALRMLAKLHRESHRFSRAAAFLERAFSLLDVGSESDRLRVRLMLEDAYLTRDRWHPDRAEAKLRKTALAAARIGAFEEFADAENALGNLARRQGDPKKAIKHYQASLRRLDPRKEPLKRARLLSNLGTAYSDTSEWEKGEEYYSQSFLIAHQSNDLLGQARLFNNAAKLFLRQNRIGEAVQAYGNADRFFVEQGDFRSAAVSMSNLSRILHDQDPKKAREAMETAAARYRSAGDLERAAAVETEFRKWTPRMQAQGWLAKLVWLSMMGFLVAFIIMLALT